MEFPYNGIENSFHRAIGAPNYKEFGGWLDRNDYICTSCGQTFTNTKKRKSLMCGVCDRLFGGLFKCIEVTEKEMDDFRRERIAKASAIDSVRKANEIARKKKLWTSFQL
jgi:hypothetical protein